jgi:nitrogenase-associated protein
MATVLFYEKPGCINNTRQKALLAAAGHDVQAHNLLTEPWSRDRLRPFFGQRPVVEWFNPSAPQVKDGEVQPDQLDEASALTLMVQHPLLIRRPLMQVGDRYEVGFDTDLVDHWIGLQPAQPSQQETVETLKSHDLQNCPRGSSG